MILPVRGASSDVGVRVKRRG